MNKLQIRLARVVIGTFVFLLALPSLPANDLGPMPWDKLYSSCMKSSVDVHIYKTGSGSAEGSGFVFNEAGYGFSNCHVVSVEGTRMVSFGDGTRLPFKVIVRKDDLDIAMIKVESDKPLYAGKLGYSSKLVVGEPVMAIGNHATMGMMATCGIISGINRFYGYNWHLPGNEMATTIHYDMIQTDAYIVGGNSGGPLYNSLGEVIGINSGERRFARRMAFSIPIDKCITLMPGLLTDAGYYKFTLGMNVDARSVGMVTNVVSGTPAEVAGVKVGDRVINVDGKTVNLGLDFWTYLIDLKPGTAVRLTLKRGKADINTTVILGAPK